MENKEINLEILEDIGLTGAEIKVFISLLELGSAVAGEVINNSKLQSAVVHRAFHSLQEKGLLSYVNRGGSKVYQAIEPEQLLTFLDEKKNQVKEIIPYLKEKQKMGVPKSSSRVFEGIKGVKKLISFMIDTDSKEYYAYGGSDFPGEMLTILFWDKFHKTKSEKGIHSKIIFHSSLQEWGRHIEKYKNTRVKVTNKEFEGITETIICGNKVAILVYTEKPFGFLIEEKEAYESYKKFFEIMWNNF